MSRDPPGMVGHLFFTHVRAATGTAVTRQNVIRLPVGAGCS
jgi:hypothetical protein